jgi:hypothetical protein
MNYIILFYCFSFFDYIDNKQYEHIARFNVNYSIIARDYLAATNLKCNDGNEYALACGGDNNSNFFRSVNIYDNNSMIF